MANDVCVGTLYVLMKRQILFLCSGNYYRSRFAEILFNHLAQEHDLEWRAQSRGIVAQWSRNPGPISPAALEGLRARNLSPEVTRYPLQLTETDLARAERIIAMYEAEHRPMLRTYFPQWENKTEFWRIPDLDEMNSENALAQLERNVRALMLALAPAKLFL